MSEAPKKETVADPTPGYEAMMQRTKLKRALMGGIEAIRKDRAELLPPAAGEDVRPKGRGLSPYDVRIKRTVLWPYYPRAVRLVVSSVLGKNIQFGGDVPALLQQHAENIDLRGNNLTVFMQRVLFDAVAYGEPTWITIDMPTVDPPGGVAKGDDLKPTDRPYWVHVASDALLNPDDLEWVNGVPRWRRVRYLREVTKPKGTWGVETVQQVRVLEPPETKDGFVRWSVYDKASENWAEEPSERGTMRPLKEIPFVCLSVGALFDELAHLNLSHTQKRSDYDNTIYKVCRPMIHRTGVTQKDKDDGPMILEAGIIFNSERPSSESDMKYVEHTGKSLDAARSDLEDLGKEQEKLALQPHVSRSGDQSATGRAIDFDEAKTEVQAVALRTKDAIEEAARIHAVMLGRGERAGGTVTLPYLALARRIEPEMARLALDALVELGYEGDQIVNELKRRGVLTEDLPMPPMPGEAPEPRKPPVPAPKPSDESAEDDEPEEPEELDSAAA